MKIAAAKGRSLEIQEMKSRVPIVFHPKIGRTIIVIPVEVAIGYLSKKIDEYGRIEIAFQPDRLI